MFIAGSTQRIHSVDRTSAVHCLRIDIFVFWHFLIPNSFRLHVNHLLFSHFQTQGRSEIQRIPSLFKRKGRTACSRTFILFGIWIFVLADPLQESIESDLESKLWRDHKSSRTRTWPVLTFPSLSLFFPTRRIPLPIRKLEEEPAEVWKIRPGRSERPNDSHSILALLAHQTLKTASRSITQKVSLSWAEICVWEYFAYFHMMLTDWFLLWPRFSRNSRCLFDCRATSASPLFTRNYSVFASRQTTRTS